MRTRKLSSPEIYVTLRQMILESELAPGARVTESELAAKFRVSRTPIREALHRLEVEGLLEIRPKQGCFIRSIDMEKISDYYNVRVALEAMAIEQACVNMPDEELKKLADIWNPAKRPRHGDAIDDVKAAEESFHITLAEHSGNPVLADYLRDVNDHIRVVRRLAFMDEKTVAETYRDHYEICRLLLKRDARGARAAMIEHITKSQDKARNVTLSQFQQHAARPLPLARRMPRVRSG